MFKLFILIKKEILQFLRNAPLLAVVLYCCTIDVYMASEFSMDIKNYRIAIYDMDKTQRSAELAGKIRRPYFIIHSYINDAKLVDKLILEGTVGAVLVIPKGFQNKITSGKSGSCQIIIDATSSNTAELALSYLYQIVSEYSSHIVLKEWYVPSLAHKTVPVIDCKTRYAYNQNLQEQWSMCIQEFFTVLALIAILLPAAAMVNEKQFGTIEQLMVAPLRPFEIMLAKIIPMLGIFIIISFISIYCIMLPIVGLPLRGSLLDFLILTVVFCFTSSGLGMLISTVSQNLSETVLMTILLLFPIMFLSGAWVPPEALPAWMQWIMMLSPLKYYLNVGMSIFLKGNTLLFMWKDFLTLLGLGLVIFFIGVLRFKKMFE